MNMKIRKKIFAGAFAATLTMGMATTALAGTWQTGSGADQGKWWYDNGDGTYAQSGWHWIDGNQDGTAECYYFDAAGWLLADTTTPDGYTVNENGAWMENGTVKTRQSQAAWDSMAERDVDKIELIRDLYIDETQGMYLEYATITASDDRGEAVWKYETPKCIATEMDAIVELGRRGDRYYFVEDTSVVCIDVQSGVVLWKNNDYAGRATGAAFGENAIYLCGQYGPDFYAVSYEGKTLARIQQFNSQYYWASEIELSGHTAAVYLYGGTEDYDMPMVYYVDLKTFNYSEN